jgi:hypothetical protein
VIGSEVKMWLAVIVVAVTLGLGIRYVRGETPDEWFKIAVAIEQEWDRLDGDERKFIANVINRLTVSPDATPTPEHRRWLLNIKQRLEHAK